MSRRQILCLVIVLTVVSTLVPSAASAANLVPNPSFELHTQCPTQIEAGFGQIHFAAPWSRAGGSPDYFHTCAPLPQVQTPDNTWGYQCPRGANCFGSTIPGGYGGIVVHIDGAVNATEYMQVRLDQPLSANKKYRVRYWVSLTDASKYAIDRLGAYLKVGPQVNLNLGLLPYVPQVESPAGFVLDDKTDWMVVEGKVLAAGGEDSLILGRFAPEEELTLVGPSTDGWWDHAYYYVDDVSVNRADIFNITTVAPPPGAGSDEKVLTYVNNAEPYSPVSLYASEEMGGGEVNGHPVDLGGTPRLLAYGTTDGQGRATLSWKWGDAVGRNTTQVHLEGWMDDPTGSGAGDSDENTLVVTSTAGW